MKAIAVVFFESTRAVGDEAGVIRKYNRGNVRARIHSAICVTVEWPKNVECIKSRLDLQLWGHLTYCDDGFEQQRCEKQHCGQPKQFLDRDYLRRACVQLE